MTPDLTELLAIHAQTATAAGEVLAELVSLTPRRGVRALLAELPGPWRRALVTWLVEAYDNAFPVDEFVSIQNPGWREQVHAVRAWIEADPAYRDEVIDDVATLLAMADDRIFSRHDLMNQLVRLSARLGTEAVVRQLPPNRHQQFIDWARGHVPADEIIAPQRPGLIEVRDWLRLPRPGS